MNVTAECNRIELCAEPLEIAGAERFVTDPAAGGIVLFIGATRAETSATGRSLKALDYAAYEPMAIQQMEDLARRARSQWPIVRLAILHRIGGVALAEPSVVIAVSCLHRGEAFEACRWIIDTLKSEVTIWKKEIWDDGQEQWVHPVAGEKE